MRIAGRIIGPDCWRRQHLTAATGFTLFRSALVVSTTMTTPYAWPSVFQWQFSVSTQCALPKHSLFPSPHRNHSWHTFLLLLILRPWEWSTRALKNNNNNNMQLVCLSFLMSTFSLCILSSGFAVKDGMPDQLCHNTEGNSSDLRISKNFKYPKTIFIWSV